MTHEEATRKARRDFGNVTVIAERSRQVWQRPTLESIWADVRFAMQSSSARSHSLIVKVRLHRGRAMMSESTEPPPARSSPIIAPADDGDENSEASTGKPGGP